MPELTQPHPPHDRGNSTGADFVRRFARLALGCVAREYPHKLDHVLSDETQIKSPKELHPAFFGCFDWHSAVHGHWLLVHLLRVYGDLFHLDEQTDIRSRLKANLTRANLAVEDSYFNLPGRPSFERPYGWAWLLKLHEELYLWDDSQGADWFDALKPLANTIVKKYLEFFPRQQYPIRAGTHFNTAFGLGFARDYADTLINKKRSSGQNLSQGMVARLGELAALVNERARSYFAADRNYRADWEPGGDDFLSPSLVEADLMRRVQGVEEFNAWFEQFLPHIKDGEPGELMNPAQVSDRNDPKIVHLDGLNLSRAWCMRNIAGAMATDSPVRRVLARSAERHAAASLSNVISGEYGGEHWLGTFAVYMLSTPTPQP